MKKALSFILSVFITISMTTPAYGYGLAKPNITYIESDGNCVYIEWTNIYGAEIYNVYRSETNKYDYEFIDTATGNSYLDSNVEYGKRYYYQVQGVSTTSFSDPSDSKSAKIVWTDKHFPINDLGRPELTTFTDEDQDCIWLLWDEIEGANAYFIYRSTSKNGTYELKYVEDKSRPIFDKDIKKNKRYYYKVQALYFDEENGTVLGGKPSLWRSDIITSKRIVKKSTKTVSKPVSQTVYVTRTGSKYHRYGCQYLRKSCYSMSKSNARAQGYTACSRCW